MLFCEVCQTEVVEDSKDWLACYCIGYPKNDVENHPPFWRRRPTKHAPDVVESAASSDISNASEVSASEAESTPATTQVM